MRFPSAIFNCELKLGERIDECMQWTLYCSVFEWDCDVNRLCSEYEAKIVIYGIGKFRIESIENIQAVLILAG